MSSTTGHQNTAAGPYALQSNTTGTFNTATGNSALSSNVTGNSNTAIGASAGSFVQTASNVICIGASVFGADVSNTTWIGNIYEVTPLSGNTAPVIVSDSGQLGTAPSSERFKKNIAVMDQSSEAILSLRPVTFQYKTDTKSIPQFGLIAEEVAKVNPALVLPDKEGKPYTVRYDAVNAMLLNEFLKEHKNVQELKAALAQQQKEIAALIAHIKEQDSKIQRVSDQLEMRNATPQVASVK